MKFDMYESQWGVDLTITPETPAECAQLLRFSNNAKAEKPAIYFNFSNDIPNLTIGMQKVTLTVQKNSISPLRRIQSPNP